MLFSLTLAYAMHGARSQSTCPQPKQLLSKRNVQCFLNLHYSRCWHNQQRWNAVLKGMPSLFKIGKPFFIAHLKLGQVRDFGPIRIAKLSQGSMNVVSCSGSKPRNKPTRWSQLGPYDVSNGVYMIPWLCCKFSQETWYILKIMACGFVCSMCHHPGVLSHPYHSVIRRVSMYSSFRPWPKWSA